jgi:HTH-type transcriptional regulator, sugar sensing transcriptional regulator
MQTKILEDIGLSKNEIEVFISLLKLGESKAGSIITSTKLQSSAVYNAISALIEKGLVSYVKKSQVKYYNAANPETITSYIETKKQEYLKILPELEGLQNKQNKEGVEYYKSTKGIRTLLSELLVGAKKGDIYRYFSTSSKEEYEKARFIYSTSKELRYQKKVTSRGLWSEELRSETRANKKTQKKFIDMSLPPNMQFINNKVAIFSWEGEPTGVLIKSKSIYDTYVKFFDDLWEKAKE